MPETHTLVLFALAALALLLVPGPAVLYIVACSAEHGRRAGLVSVAGVHVGTLVHTTAAAVGLSALVVSSAVAFSTVKYAGAAYLVYLGIRKLVAGDDVEPETSGAVSTRGLFLQGAVVNILNPKTALFFLAFVPQFVDPDRAVWPQVVAFGLTFVVVGFVSDGLYAIAAGSLAGWLRHHARRSRLASGSILVGLGAVAAFAKRS